MTEYASEIHKLLKLGDNLMATPFGNVPEGLPIAPDADLKRPRADKNEDLHKPHVDRVHDASAAMKKIRSILIYPVIFAVTFAFFFVVLNFSSVIGQVQGFFVVKPQDEQILGDQTADYYSWINNYYYVVSERKLLDPNNDIDKDGLSNGDEFIMRTNPIVADSDSDNFLDGIEIINNYNPWGAGSMTKAQKELFDKLDLITINNRVSFNASVLQKQLIENRKVNFDLNKPGQLSIPKLNLQVPLIWSNDPANFDTDLQKGVVHYPGTALPGELGTIYVSGHSSDYLWKKNPFRDVFAKINYLTSGDDIFVQAYGTDGKTYIFRYQVSASRIYKPDDQGQFIDDTSYKLNLSTCWPIGTNKDRLVVSAIAVEL